MCLCNVSRLVCENYYTFPTALRVKTQVHFWVKWWFSTSVSTACSGASPWKHQSSWCYCLTTVILEVPWWGKICAVHFSNLHYLSQWGHLDSSCDHTGEKYCQSFVVGTVTFNDCHPFSSDSDDYTRPQNMPPYICQGFICKGLELQRTTCRQISLCLNANMS